MERVLWLISLALILNSSLAKEFKCQKSGTTQTIEISTEIGAGKFRYYEKDNLLLSLNIADQYFDRANYWDSDNQYFYFNPGWGESTVHIFGKFSTTTKNAVFEILARGMVGNVEKTLIGFSCNEINK